MIWLLIICTHVNGGSHCLPVQVFHNQGACMFAGRLYRKAPDVIYSVCGGPVRD